MLTSFSAQPLASQKNETLIAHANTLYATPAQSAPSTEKEVAIDFYDESIWRALYPSLRSLARHLAGSTSLSYWTGRKEELAEDILQETLCRLIERQRKVEAGKAEPIQSLKQMANTIAYNYCHDLQRREKRLSRLDGLDPYNTERYCVEDEVQQRQLELVEENIDAQEVFYWLAQEVQHFPTKQKRALLTDLANRMAFETEPTPLQAAFLQIGIDFRAYKRELPTDRKQRSQHVSLLSQAYKRLEKLAGSVQALALV